MKSFAAEQLDEHYGRPVMRRKAVRSRCQPAIIKQAMANVRG